MISNGGILKGEDLKRMGIERDCPNCGHVMDFVSPPVQAGKSSQDGYKCTNCKSVYTVEELDD